MKDTFLTKYFQSEHATPMYQVIFAVTVGILLSPWSSGLFFLIVFTLIYEIVFYLFTFGKPEYWQLETRLAVIYGYFFGWIVGRSLCNQEILTAGVPNTMSQLFSPENLL